MILVTVGSTLPFDELLKSVDDLCAEDFFDQEVVCQTGHGAYAPRHCKHFRFTPSLDDMFKKADVIVCHGGTGSVLQCILLAKPFIAFANPRADEDHQGEFLSRMSQITDIVWSRDPLTLKELYPQLQGRSRDRKIALPSLADDLLRQLGARAAPGAETGA